MMLSDSFATSHHQPVVYSADTPPAFLRPDQTYALYYKRLLDVWLSVGLLLLASPFLLPMTLAITALIAMDGHNPIYSQRRIGRHGRIFRMFKFRTMVPEADQKLAAYLKKCPEAKAEWDKHQKLRYDPRITTVGRFLRKTSLDELPQLINVLRGEMSLVGPRPMMVEQTGMYPGRAYYLTRPGLTGMWQVSDRHDSSFAERAGYDDAYLHKLSLRTDMRILLRTVVVVLRGTGV
ncbi:sugar transferase [Donghicola mangrovi]|nr:sugar transferase [Donghicola mangrovi]